MRKMAIAPVLASLAFAFGTNILAQQEKQPAAATSAPSQMNKTTADAMTRALRTTNSLEVFGEGIRRQILEAAVKEVEKGKGTTEVTLKFSARVIKSSLPRVPS